MKTLLFLLLFIPTIIFSQTLEINGDLTIVHFNANWNGKNAVVWVDDLSDCKIKYCDIATDGESQKKYEIVVVPTIIIFNEGEEVKRFQADISFAMKATLKEVQGVIDEILMEGF